MSTREQSAQLRNSGLTIAVLAITSAPLLAQSAFPRADVFGGYSWVSLDSGSSRHNLNGWTGQASVNLNSWFGVTGDFGGYYGKVSGATIHDYTCLFGPTFTYRAPHVDPFFHALFGGSHVTGSGGGASVSNSAFAMGIGGGLDVSIGSVVGFRLAQVDWLRTQHFSSSQNNIRLSTGIFLQFGK